MISRIARLRGTYGPGFREELGIWLIGGIFLTIGMLLLNARDQSINMVLYSALEADLGGIL